MKNCKHKDCVSNRNGVCVLDESAVDSHGVKMYTILIVILGILLFALYFSFGGNNPEIPVVAPTVTAVPTPDVKHGQYTIFHYTKSGWVTRLYVTDYYITTDHIVYYKSREHQDEFQEVLLDDCLPVPGWIENTDELMNYGFWEYPEEEYTYE